MLGCTRRLALRLEASTPLGADYPRLPAGAVFLEHSCESDPLAAGVGLRSSNVMDFVGNGGARAIFATRGQLGSPAKADETAVANFENVAADSERFASAWRLDCGFFGVHGGVARPADGAQAGWDFGQSC